MEDLLIKAATVVAVALAAFSSFPSPAQQDQQTQQTSSTLQQQVSPQEVAMLQEPTTVSQSQSSPTQSQALTPSQAQPDQQPNVKTVQLEMITGELQKKLDSNSAKPGDSVVLTIREDATIPNGAAIPKGSKLLGHVTNVRPRSAGAENSQITLQFDRAELKSGQSLPIASVLESVAPSAGESMMMNNNNGMVPMPSTPGTAGVQSNGTAPAAANTTNNTTVNQNSGNDRPGLPVRPTSQTPDQNAANSTPAAGSIVARSGNVAIRTTSIPGVLLANNISGQPFTNASGMLLGARRDIKLEGGTQMVVAVAAAQEPGGIHR